MIYAMLSFQRSNKSQLNSDNKIRISDYLKISTSCQFEENEPGQIGWSRISDDIAFVGAGTGGSFSNTSELYYFIMIKTISFPYNINDVVTVDANLNNESTQKRKPTSDSTGTITMKNFSLHKDKLYINGHWDSVSQSVLFT